MWPSSLIRQSLSVDTRETAMNENDEAHNSDLPTRVQNPHKDTVFDRLCANLRWQEKSTDKTS